MQDNIGISEIIQMNIRDFQRNFEIDDWPQFKKALPIYREIDTHPKSRGIKSGLFSSISFESTEIEYLDLLYGLVLAAKPINVLETGTNIGISSIAMGYALKYNYEHGQNIGGLETIEQNELYFNIASELINILNLKKYVTNCLGDIFSFVRKINTYKRYNLIYFDSSRKIRPTEFYTLINMNMIEEGCLIIFHDTCAFSIKDIPNDEETQSSYISSLEVIKNYCNSYIKFDLSRGLTIFQY
jgi:predicted O-methyltransferase YrrM